MGFLPAGEPLQKGLTLGKSPKTTPRSQLAKARPADEVWVPPLALLSFLC